jgi:hypothetical protein
VRADTQAHVVADPGRELYARYGVGRSWRGLLMSMLVPSFYWRFLRATALGFWGGAVDDSMHTMPADFLVSPDGVIRLAHYGRHIGDHVPISRVVAHVAHSKASSPRPGRQSIRTTAAALEFAEEVGEGQTEVRLW